jgi:hypothetical protein
MKYQVVKREMAKMNMCALTLRWMHAGFKSGGFEPRGEPAVSILICLCHACSYHEILRTETAGQDPVCCTRWRRRGTCRGRGAAI